ncbi:hypothetical protein NC653_040511 [Populus alba x Populus x berolinensis]|uniref:Uncharacterized protein n=1 Tax=Populus alba x Populus x berolinensis TaxID=444605 RepID=A0AAD6L8N6_9ROSI|nr:hypothetical protein NC653_040511 [Populus alba x Populus x berolinensis]
MQGFISCCLISSVWFSSIHAIHQFPALL